MDKHAVAVGKEGVSIVGHILLKFPKKCGTSSDRRQSADSSHCQMLPFTYSMWAGHNTCMHNDFYCTVRPSAPMSEGYTCIVSINIIMG